MVEIKINTELDAKGTIDCNGNTNAILDELSYAVYRILSQLNMKDKSIQKRINIFEGGLLFHALTDGHNVFDE